MPNFTFCEGRKQAMTKFILFMNLDMVDRNSAPEEFACIWQSKRVGIITIETEKNMNSLFHATFSWLSTVVVSVYKYIYARRGRCKREYMLLDEACIFGKASLVFGQTVFWAQIGILYQTESFLTACISLVHEPDKPWSKQQPSCTNTRKELRRCVRRLGNAVQVYTNCANARRFDSPCLMWAFLKTA